MCVYIKARESGQWLVVIQSVLCEDGDRTPKPTTTSMRDTQVWECKCTSCHRPFWILKVWVYKKAKQSGQQLVVIQLVLCDFACEQKRLRLWAG